MNINDTYRLGNKQLGKGSFAEVFLGTNIKNGLNVAIKCVSLAQTKFLDKLITEIDIMQKMNHGNVVKYHDLVKCEDYWYIVMEYCNAGTLADVIRYNAKYNASQKESNTYYYLSQMKNALQYIRLSGYVHRDLKPMNVLLIRPEVMIQSDSDVFVNDITFNDKIQTDWDESQNLIVKVADF